MKYRELVEPLEQEMIASLQRLVKYNSRRGEPEENAPFGKVPAACLDEALAMAGEMGFATHNLDHYCGWAEMGEGEEIIGIAAHLDIVPAGEGWDTDPFTVVRKGDLLYGRGVSDDKGAAVASLYAMKLVREMGVPMKRRVRLLMGTDEECGSGCMEYYRVHGEPVAMGFTPDGNFPGIYGEKGHCTMLVKSKNTKILSLEGGFVTNAVCDRCAVKIPAEVEKAALEKALAATPLTSFTVTEEDGAFTIDARGVAAHASMPLLGVNAASFTMKALKDAGFRDDFVDFYLARIGTACDGSGMGLKLEDDYGPLTLNNGIVRAGEDGGFEATIDIRYPVTFNSEQIRAFAAPFLEDERGKVEILKVSEPLFYPRDSVLVESLLQAWRTVTGDTELEPLVIGGGTYAQHVPGIIAFGCEVPGVDNHIHDRNESLSVEEWKMQVCVYMEAILRLLEA